MSTIEQRRHPRIDVNWPATLTDAAGRRIEGFVIDASQGGIGFVTMQACEAGTNYEAHICIPAVTSSHHDIRAVYKCVHARAVDMQLGNCKAGMQLVDIDQDDLDALIAALFETGKNNFSL